MLMQSSNLQTCLISVAAPFCFSRELPLQFGKFLFALCEVLMVFISNAVRWNSEVFDTHVNSDHRAGPGQSCYFCICAAQSYKVFAAWIAGYSGRKNSAFYLFRNTVFHCTKLRQLYGLIQYLDICAYTLAFIALPVVVLAFEAWETGLLSVLYAPEEVLIRVIEITERRL